MRTPALWAWRDELRTGKRTKYDFDALWRAACYELNAHEAWPPTKEHFQREAARILRDAAKRRAA